MNNYTIYCSSEQTKKAFELGAPIEYAKVIDTINGNSIRMPEETGEFYLIPNAEQMIGWLEGQDGIEGITVCNTGMWIWGKNHTLIDGCPDYSSRQESSLAAIDAALEYLSNNK